MSDRKKKKWNSAETSNHQPDEMRGEDPIKELISKRVRLMGIQQDLECTTPEYVWHTELTTLRKKVKVCSILMICF